MDVHQHYQGLLDRFTKCGKGSGFKISTPRVRLQPFEPPHGLWNDLDLVDGYMSLKADISRGSTNGFAEDLDIESGEMEILIFPRERIRIGAPWNIKRSQIEVAHIYYDLAADKTFLLLALHFDFSVKDTTLEPATAHPIFHVSLTDKPMMLRGVLHQKSVVLDRMSGIPDVRLPTAHMTFPSVLIGIAADRFLPDQFALFLSSVRAAGDYPRMENNPFTLRMNAHGNRMRSCAWYAS